MKQATLTLIIAILFLFGTGVQCVTPPPAYAQDADGDNILDEFDNCPATPNGPLGGTCTQGTIGDFCLSHSECGTGGVCSMGQEDTRPVRGNQCGDACECEGNFDGDDDQDGSDAFAFKQDFGRSVLLNPCTTDTTCNGDFDCDSDCDGSDAFTFKKDFGRSPFQNPCPSCVTIPWCSYPPPDPTITAPPLDPTVAATVFSSTQFLYTGDNPVQTGMDQATINPVRVAVIRGKVLDKGGTPLRQVIITILDHPEFGQTLSRADGMFDMAVNGGGMLTVNYEKDGYLPAQRTIDCPLAGFYLHS